MGGREMSVSSLAWLLIVSLIALGCTKVAVQGQGTDGACLALLAQLQPCSPYVQNGPATANTSTSAPGADCCTPLASLLSTQPTCFCQITKLNVAVNLTRASQTAASCNTTIPSSVVSCLTAGILSPTSAPSASTPSKQPPSSESPGGTDNAGQSGNGSILSPLTFGLGTLLAFTFALIVLL